MEKEDHIRLLDFFGSNAEDILTNYKALTSKNAYHCFRLIRSITCLMCKTWMHLISNVSLVSRMFFSLSFSLHQLFKKRFF